MTSARCRKDPTGSLAISQRLLEIREIAVFHHADRGMQTLTTGQPREKLKGSAEAGDTEEVTAATDAIWPAPRTSVPGEVAKEEAECMKTYPLMPKEPEVIGWVYRVDNLNISPKVPDS